VSDKKASFSNYNAGVSVSAPGSRLVTAYPNHRYALVWGTSFAAPLVAAEAALATESWDSKNRPTASSNFINLAILRGVDTTIYSVNPPIYFNKLGSGRINMWKAYRRATLQ